MEVSDILISGGRVNAALLKLGLAMREMQAMAYAIQTPRAVLTVILGDYCMMNDYECVERENITMLMIGVHLLFRFLS